MDYKGTIIEESLEDKSVLEMVNILETKVEDVIEKHQTPWLKKWTLDKVEIEENKAQEIAEKLSENLDSEHDWYADYKNPKWHYIIFKNKVFKVDRKSEEQYTEARNYGISLGIPENQVDFSPDIK